MKASRPKLELSRSSAQEEIENANNEVGEVNAESVCPPGGQARQGGGSRRVPDVGLQLANQEATTPLWFALRLGPSTFAVFDAFRDEAGRQNHLNGPIAKALMAQAPTLLATPPVIERVEVLGVKLPEVS